MKGVRVGILAGESQDVIHDVGPRSGLVSYAYFFQQDKSGFIRFSWVDHLTKFIKLIYLVKFTKKILGLDCLNYIFAL